MTREREGLQLVKFFLDYCFVVSDMLTLNPPDEIVKNLKDYALKMCDDCGGAMCDVNCPVSRYVEDMDKWLKGEGTVFATDRTKRRNCDVGTVAEQYKRFRDVCDSKDAQQCSYCEMRGLNGPNCSRDKCYAIWSQMPYKPTEEQNDRN